MKQLFIAITLGLFMLSGCATAPKADEPKRAKIKTLCEEAADYVHTVAQTYESNYPGAIDTKLEYCKELKGNVTYFIYSAVTDVAGVEDASEVHVLVVLQKVGGQWRIVAEAPFMADMDSEAQRLLQQQNKNPPLEVDNGKKTDEPAAEPASTE